jgi:hypothetical protein
VAYLSIKYGSFIAQSQFLILPMEQRLGTQEYINLLAKVIRKAQ